MDPPVDPPGSSPPPPPRPPKLSYAAASSSPSTKQPNPPPRVPPKPTNLQHSPVASTNFFAASSPAQAASASTSSPAPPVPRATKPRQPSYPQQPLELGGDGASSNGELLSTTAPAGPSTLKKRTSGAHSSPSVTRTYGSSGGGSTMRRDRSGGQDVPWANEPVPDLPGAASPAAPPRAPPVPPRAWQTPARGPAGDVGDAAAWGAQSWQQLAAAGNADSATHEVHVGPATPSPPPPPSPDARQQAQPQQHLLEWAPPPGPDLPIKRDTWWTTPRVLAGPGDMGGGKKGVWDEEVWDFVVGPTPEGEIAMKDERYPPMGAWVPLGPDRGVGEAGGNAPVVDTAADVPASSSGASEDTAMAVGDDDAAAASTSTSTADKPLPPVNLTSSSSPPPELPPKPSRGFHTVSLDDLDRARPHLNLYFCPSTFSWTLFAPIRRLSPASLLDSGPPLWHVHESCVPLELERYFAERLVEQGHLAHPQAPFAPARPDQFSAQHDARTEANGATFADACAAGGGLVELRTMDGKGSVAVGGTAFYPAVIPRALWERLMRERGDSPAVGKSADEARFEAARVIWRTLNNLLFAGEKRHLPTLGKHMSKFMPFDTTTNDIFVATLGFDYLAAEAVIAIPHLDEADERGRENRSRLLRCWLEVGIWLEDFTRKNADKGVKAIGTRITLKSVKPAMQAALGGDDLPRAPATGRMSSVSFTRTTSSQSDKDALADDYDKLGITPDLADHIVSHVYDQQVQRDAPRTAVMLDALIRIAQSRGSSALEEKVAIERSLDRHPASEIVNAYKELQLDNPFLNYVSEDQITMAFDARNSAVEHRERRRVLFEAAKVVAAHSQNDVLKAMLESMNEEIVRVAAPSGHAVVKPKMSLDAAYRALGFEPGVDLDESTISMLYTIRLDDASSDTEKAKMREALEVIADDKKSKELYTLAQTGKRTDDSSAGWQAGPAVDLNVPVGLTNIANTCYLNSLLQYFFTVREVRDTILAFHDTPTPSSQQGQLRVGGRLVSLAEVKRSKRFVALLQILYQQLIHSPISAVTPETELAYLALVPSREEAEASAAPAAAATLTEEPEPIIVADSDKPVDPAASTGVRSPSSSSVLGKRKVGEEGAASPPSVSGMQLDSQQPQQTPLSSPTLASGGAAMASLSLPPASLSAVGPTEDADMADARAPDDDEMRRSKRGKSEEERSGASSVTERQDESPNGPEADEPMSVDPQPSEGEAGEMPPPLPPRRTDAPSPEPQPEQVMPPLVGGDGGPSGDKQKELERQVSSYMAFGRQNDVTECMDNVMFQVEAALLANAPSGQEHAPASLLRRTFYGTMRQQIVFDDASVPDPVRTQDEPFSSLLVDVSPSPSSGSGAPERDIYDGLDAVFAPSPITLEGHAAQRRVALVSPPPPVLQIQLQRVQYDREKQSVYKSNAHLQFYEEIGVARYVEVGEEDEAGRLRAQKTDELRRILDKKRTRLAELTKDKDSNTATTLRSLSSHVDKMYRREPEMRYRLPYALRQRFDASSTLLADTEAEAAAIDKETDELKNRIAAIRAEMEHLWCDREEGTKYELTAVFIHRGTALSGHYYIYQRDHRDPQRWLRYNDSVVSEVSKDEVFKATTGDTNAYFLSYVRQDCSEAIESIKREL